jgi:hypothetical protein
MPRDDAGTLELSAIIQCMAERSYNACRDRPQTPKILRLALDFSIIWALRVDVPSETELHDLLPR